jgi:hypothetical protein
VLTAEWFVGEWSEPNNVTDHPVRKTSKLRASQPTADEIAEMATRGEDISAYFTNKFTLVGPVERVNVDLTQGMLRELDARAAQLNISRQAVIKTLLGQALNEEGLRRRSKKETSRTAAPPLRPFQAAEFLA